jgi:hypothetical protein
MRTPRIVQGGDAAARVSGAILFRILWDSLVDLLGAAATAVLVHRATRRAQHRSRELCELAVARVDGQFTYVVPHSFDRAIGPPVALRDLADELRPLLVEMTGEVALRHLEQVPELRSWVRASPQPL